MEEGGDRGCAYGEHLRWYMLTSCIKQWMHNVHQGPEMLALVITEGTCWEEWWKVLSSQILVPRGALNAVLTSLDHITSKWQSQDIKSLGLLSRTLHHPL